MAAVPFMPLYVADYMADAAHLSTLEHGAYLLLIMAYWQRGEALPDDDKKLARIVGLQGANWRKVAPVLREFFITESGKLFHHRIEHELQRMRDKSLKNRKGGLARAKQALSERSADAEQTLSHTDTHRDTDTHKEEKPPKAPRKRWVDCPVNVSPEVWQDWRTHRKTVFTDTALQGLLREADKAGWTAEAAICEAIERGWQGFKADWVKDKSNERTGNSTASAAQRALAIIEGGGG